MDRRAVIDESLDHHRARGASYRPWTSSFSVRSLLAPRPTPRRPRLLQFRGGPRGLGPPAGEFNPRPNHLGVGAAPASLGTTLIERYIYSLPDYRLHERQRRNFIEIHSFNGLLATRKVIGINSVLYYSVL